MSWQDQGVSPGEQAECEAAMCSWGKEGKWYPRQKVEACNPSLLVRPHLECWVLFWTPQYKDDMGHTGEGPAKGHDDEGMEMSLVWGKVEKAECVKAWEEKAQGDDISVCKYQKWGCREDRVRHFPVVPGSEAMGTNWNAGASVWTPRNTLLLWGSSTVTNCPERLWTFPPRKTFKSHLDMALGTRCPCMNKGLDQMTSRGPFQSYLFCDSVIHGGFFPYIVLTTCRTTLNTSNCSLELISWNHPF